MAIKQCYVCSIDFCFQILVQNVSFKFKIFGDDKIATSYLFSQHRKSFWAIPTPKTIRLNEMLGCFPQSKMNRILVSYILFNLKSNCCFKYTISNYKCSQNDQLYCCIHAPIVYQFYRMTSNGQSTVNARCDIKQKFFQLQLFR